MNGVDTAKPQRNPTGTSAIPPRKLPPPLIPQRSDISSGADSKSQEHGGSSAQPPSRSHSGSPRTGVSASQPPRTLATAAPPIPRKPAQLSTSSCPEAKAPRQPSEINRSSTFSGTHDKLGDSNGDYRPPLPIRRTTFQDELAAKKSVPPPVQPRKSAGSGSPQDQEQVDQRPRLPQRKKSNNDAQYNANGLLDGGAEETLPSWQPLRPGR